MRSGSMLRPEQGSGSSEWARPCESCAAAPSSVYCRADGAYLCAGCDADIHSANPLARRHQRDDIFPLHHNHGRHLVGDIDKVEAADEEEAASWLVTANPNNGFLFGGEEEEEEEYHDVAEENGERSEGTEQMVPMECMVSNQHLNLNLNHHQLQQQLQEQQYFPMGLESEVSGVGFGYSATLTHSVSFSSMDSGEVPENSTMVDNNSNSHCRVSQGTIDLFSGHPALQAAPPQQFSPMDREARVLRYREKKMKRKFEKTIRYASRKAYAETRPRIKGRFAKRSDVELEVDQMFSTSEGSYGLVPSF